MNFHPKASPTFGTSMKLKKLALSAGVALALGMAAVSAQAGTTVWHFDINGDPVQDSYVTGNYNMGTIGTANVFQTAELPFAGSFSDVFNFTLGLGTKAITGISTDFTGLAIPSIGMTMTLTANGAPVASVASIPNSLTSFGSKVVYGYTFTGLTAGTNYSLTVSGTHAEVLGVYYKFNVAAVAAVPEPETYAMLLAGLGLIGSIVRRRNSSKMGS